MEIIRQIRGISRLCRGLAHILFGIYALAYVGTFGDAVERIKTKQKWSKGMLAILGIRTDGSTADLDFGHEPGLVVCNHISFLDIFAINAIVPSSFVSKDDVSNWPLVGWLAKKADTIFITRGSRRAAHKTRELIISYLQHGKRVAIFPEGTTTNGNAMLPFHSALFQSAIDADVPVQCWSIKYLSPDGQPTLAPAYVGDLSLMQCLWQIVTSPPITVQLRRVSLIEPPYSDRRHLAHQAHQLIARATQPSQATH